MKLIIFISIILVLSAFVYENVDLLADKENSTRDNISADEVIENEGLHPTVEKQKEKFLERTADRNINVVITETYRSKERQNDLFARGRSSEGEIVTHAAGGESYHNYGLAIDFALRTDEGDVVWDVESDFNGSGKPDWLEAAEIAKDLGFEWGGDWSGFRDYPHLQMTFGLTINELQEASPR
nr:M15 family metallopeptidase [Alkalicoccus halolimnae]